MPKTFVRGESSPSPEPPEVKKSVDRDKAIKAQLYEKLIDTTRELAEIGELHIENRIIESVTAVSPEDSIYTVHSESSLHGAQAILITYRESQTEPPQEKVVFAKYIDPEKLGFEMRAIERCRNSNITTYLPFQALRSGDKAVLLTEVVTESVPLSKYKVRDIEEIRALTEEVGKTIIRMNIVGVFHGDLQPKNILYTYGKGGTIFTFIDFERASITDELTPITEGQNEEDIQIFVSSMVRDLGFGMQVFPERAEFRDYKRDERGCYVYSDERFNRLQHELIDALTESYRQFLRDLDSNQD